MTKVRICLDLDERVFRSYEAEARREGVAVESLIQKVVDGLLRELEHEEEEEREAREPGAANRPVRPT